LKIFTQKQIGFYPSIFSNPNLLYELKHMKFLIKVQIGKGCKRAFLLINPSRVRKTMFADHRF